MKHLTTLIAAFLLAAYLPACNSDSTGTEPENTSAPYISRLSISSSESTTAPGAVIPYTDNASNFEYSYDAHSGRLHV
ncbi:MAG: hypothetical protein WC824_07645, partial [Bacteroidota bacterium]